MSTLDAKDSSKDLNDNMFPEESPKNSKNEPCIPKVNMLNHHNDQENKSILKKSFEKIFNQGHAIDDEELTTVCAPGRVNLIGGHTDYCQGFVFPLAIGLKTYVIGMLNNTESTVNVFSENIPEDSPEAPSNFVSLDLKDIKSTKFLPEDNRRWANYIIGVLACFHNPSTLKGVNIGIRSEVPLGGGLSSSASLEVGVYTFLEEVFIDPANDKIQKATLCRKAENEYAGLPCGIMDQLICATAKVGHVTLIDCEFLYKSKYVAMADQEVVFLITDSNVKHELSGSEYPERKRATERAAEACGKKSLRHVRNEDLERVREENKLDETTLMRAKHVVTENSITTSAAEALKVGDYESVGAYMFQSHNSLSKLYDVSCDEQDKLVEIVKDCEGVYGSRMTGGGFGGCTVTLVEKRRVSEVIDKIHREYFKSFDKTATFYITQPNEGARVLMF